MKYNEIDWEFASIEDVTDPPYYAEWNMVGWDEAGNKYTGTCGASPYHPEESNDGKVENIEQIDPSEEVIVRRLDPELVG